MNRFYEDVLEQIEDAADRAVLARWRSTCPKMPELELEEWWRLIVKAEPTRAAARDRIDEYLDMHDRAAANGGRIFDDYGNVLEDDASEGGSARQ
jgi:hypothetical protein